MKMPSQIELDYAINWLQCNEGQIEENSSCNAVANWLIWCCNERNIKAVSKETGMSVSKIRARLKANS